MRKFIISNNTYAVVATYSGAKIIEKDETKYIDVNTKTIINNSCKYYGSSLEGRIDGTKTMLGISYKAPIIISEHLNLIMFPTASIRGIECNWINLDSVDYYYSKTKEIVEIIFKNGEKLNLKLSFGIFDRQILRASRLKSVFLGRKL